MNIAAPSRNHLKPEDRAVHDWYRFVLSFPPHLVREYIRKFELSDRHRVLDPFCGTGTTIVECKKMGIPSLGIEATPMASFACQTKIDWQVDPQGLIDHATAIAERVDEEYNDPAHVPLELHEETVKLLVAGSISPKPLDRVLGILHYLGQHSDYRYSAHERLALAKVMVGTAANIKFRPEVSVTAPKADAPVLGAWLGAIKQMAHDMEQVSDRRSVDTFIHYADARSLASRLEPQSIDAVITSPPYPNEKDYTRTTRLESVLLGFLNSKEELRAMKKGLLRSNSRSVYKADTDDQWVLHHAEVQRVASEIEARRIELGKTSGFEKAYHKAVKHYFGGMARHLADLRPALRPGAQLAYVVGDQASYLQVMIRTGQLLASVAEGLGYEVTDIDLFRTRTATKTNMQIREEVVCLRWKG